MAMLGNGFVNVDRKEDARNDQNGTSGPLLLDRSLLPPWMPMSRGPAEGSEHRPVEFKLPLYQSISIPDIHTG